jgi:ADP-heptose:LPS heptosyltransferase
MNLVSMEPFLLEQSLHRPGYVDERRVHPDTEDCYIIQGEGVVTPEYTGLLFGRIQFIKGIARTKKYYDVRLCVMRGCRDVTPPDVKARLNTRDLSKILIIRGAAWGDSLILTPAIRALKEKYPHAIIDVFGRKDSKVVFQYNTTITNILSCRESELGLMIDEYDEVFDMVHSIENNAKADRSNALDVAAEILGVEVLDPRPIYLVTQQEMDQAKALLTSMGVPLSEKIVIVQAEATAHVRSLPIRTALLLAQDLVEKGCYVIFAGHKQDLSVSQLFQCAECKYLDGFTVPPNLRNFKGKCKSCNKDTFFEIIPRSNRIKFLQQYIGNTPPRVIFATAGYAKLIIAVDSFWAHLSAALSIPSVQIYSNYHPFTRTKYYGNAAVVAPDYENVVHCGPCASLMDKCHHSVDGYAPCIGTITVEQILKAAYQQLDQKLSQVWQQDQNTYLSPKEITSVDVRACPLCGHAQQQPCNELTTKRDMIYIVCQKCRTFYTHAEFTRDLRPLVKGSKTYRPNRNKELSEISSVISEILKSKLLPSPANQRIGDLVSYSDLYLKRDVEKIWSKKHKGAVQEFSETGRTPILTGTTIWVDGFMESNNPLETLNSLIARMTSTYFVVITPVADLYPASNHWEPLNPVVAGSNVVIPSMKGLSLLVKKIPSVTLNAVTVSNGLGYMVLSRAEEKDKAVE